MTPRTPLDEEDYKLLVRARNSAHGWLLENCKEPPAVPFGPQGVLVDLKGEDGQPTELPPQVLPTPHHWIRKKVELIATIGAPAGEDPASAAGLVRQFLREVLATLNEPRRAVMLEELRKTATRHRHGATDLQDDGARWGNSTTEGRGVTSAIGSRAPSGASALAAAE